MKNAIETQKLTKFYKTREAVHELDLTVREGELYALLGVNGAGKTTTVKMLCGLSRPSSGDAKLLGSSIVTETRQAKQYVGISPQETAVAAQLSVQENLLFTARIYGFSRVQAQAKAAELLEAFSLTARAGDKAKSLSGGMQRRLSLAMALVSEPKILFLDEPTLGLDVLARRELWQAVQKLKGRVTVVLTTHYMEEAEALADRIGIMAGGRLLAEGTPAALREKTGLEKIEDIFISITQGEART